MSFFLFPQLITATIESAINKLSKLDESFFTRCQVVLGKRLLVDIQELKTPIVLICGEDKITVLTAEADQLADGSIDCSIKTSLSVMKELTDPNQITRLIKDGHLALDGDIGLAQQVSVIINETDIDWEEHLAYFIGDGLAHQIVTRFRQFSDLLEEKNTDLTRILTEFAQDEWQVSPHPDELQQFSRDVSDTRAKVDRLATKLGQVSKQLKYPKVKRSQE